MGEPVSLRPRWTRSPIYLLSLVIGALVTMIGWATATLFERSLLATAGDLAENIRLLPAWAQRAPGTIVALGVVAGFLSVHVWLLNGRHLRRLALAYGAMASGASLSVLAGTAVLAAQRPTIRLFFESLPDTAARTLPTSPVVAAVVAVLVLVRPWIPRRSRLAILGAFAIWLLHNLVIGDAPPYLGVVVDLGVGMIGASLVALAAKTPNLQPDAPEILAGLGRCGLALTGLRSADVDARGSEPWLGETPEGGPVFVKALSGDQRSADLLFRVARWIRLRRAGDGPPEVSLRRAGEHEALVSHHARSLGVATPRLLAVAAMGENRLALAYERLDGRSLDKVSPDVLTDEVMAEVWSHVVHLRSHAIAHRDLRLANVFLGRGGSSVLLDFGFAELSASQQLLDTDVAELLAASSAVMGVRRAVAVAIASIGSEVLQDARDWLHPLALSRATRAAVAQGEGLEALRDEVGRVTGHSRVEYEPLGRLSLPHLIGVVLPAIGLYSVLAVVLEDDLVDRVGRIDADLALASVAVGALVPALVAGAFRAASGGRSPYRSTLRAALASETPVTALSYWSWANRVLSDAARDAGTQARRAKRAAVTWTSAGLLSAPLLVAAFVAASQRVSRGYLQGIGLGLACGVALAALEVGMLRWAPTARELVRVWLGPFRPPSFRDAGLTATTGWWAAVRIAQGLAFALAARATGVETSLESLIAIAVSAYAVASLIPAPGGLGVIEVLTYLGLAIDSDPVVAGIAVVLARVATFWVHLPVAGWAYRSTHRYSKAHAERLVAR